METAQPRETTAILPSADEDQHLIRRVLPGEQAAYTRLVNKYRQQVFAVAFRFTHNHQEADDLAQETFIKAYRNLHKFRHDATFKTWLLRITTNASINMTKSGRISKDSGEAPNENLLRTSEGSVLQQLMAGERKEKLRRAITKLPPKQKETLLLKTYKDLTCEEVAGLMNCSVGTVKANVFNALKRLKTILNPGG